MLPSKLAINMAMKDMRSYDMLRPSPEKDVPRREDFATSLRYRYVGLVSR